jgi:hypothetical protein
MLPPQPLSKRPPAPFRGATSNITAWVLVHPKVLRIALQYFVPLFQSLLDRGPYAFVATHRGTREVLERDDDFAIGPQVGPAMLCGPFVLGTDRGPRYRKDLAFLWETFFGIAQPSLPAGGLELADQSLPNGARFALPRHFQCVFDEIEKEVRGIVGPPAGPKPPASAGAKSKAPAGSAPFDLVAKILRPVCAGHVVRRHFGIDSPEAELDEEWESILWDVLKSVAFRIILPGKVVLEDDSDPVAVDLHWSQKALEASIDCSIIKAAAKTSAERRAETANVIDRMFEALTQRKLPDREIRDTIRRNAAGLATVGCHPIAKAAAQAIDVLLDNQLAFEKAKEAARAGDKDLFWSFIYEALRFFPPFPLVTRACPRHTAVSEDQEAPRRFDRGQTVAVGLLPAMFDDNAVPFPYQFRTDRAEKDSLVFGHGLHACFGYQFARGVLIAMLMPLFARGFTRIKGRNGKLYFDLLAPNSFLVDLAA